jgi:hypothetical protein
MKLTDNEIREINQYLEAGKALPEKYRFLLFDDKREVELVGSPCKSMQVDFYQRVTRIGATNKNLQVNAS